MLLFDVMGTLVYDPFYREVPRFFGMGFDEMMAAKHPTSWIRYELGEIDEATFLASFFADGRDYDRGGLVEAMRASYCWLDGMQELLAELHGAGHAIHALSNYSDWYRRIEGKLELSRYLEWSFVSCDMGLRKPDPEAFRVPARRLGLPPERCLFVDDREVNCVAARETGMPALLFRDAEGLRGALRGVGVLV